MFGATNDSGNGYTRNGVIFGVDNSSSSHTDNGKSNSLVLDGRDTLGINEIHQRKSIVLILEETKAKFCMSLHCNGGNS